MMHRPDSPLVSVRASPLLGHTIHVSGVSLGECPFRCVYCPAPPLRPTTRRRRFVEPAEVAAMVDGAWERAGGVDYVVIGGHGDPLLWTGLGDALRRLRARHHAPIAVLTPGSLLLRPSVRAGVERAELVVVKVDAGTERVLRAVNRPHRGVRLKSIVEGLVAFGSSFPGRLWVQTVAVPGLNDLAADRDARAALIAAIAPTTLVRGQLGPSPADPSAPWNDTSSTMRVVSAAIVPDGGPKPDAGDAVLRHATGACWVV